MLIKFLQYLKLRGVSSASLKYYKSDITNFINWAGEKEITAKLIKEYIKAQTFTSPKTTINRRLSTLRSYSQFLGRNFMLGVNNVTDVKSVQAPEIKVPKTSAYRFLQEKILARFERKPRVQNAFFKLFFVRPNWYKTYHTYPIASYIHIAILVLFTSLSGYALYDQVFRNANNPLAFPTALTRPNRYLSFQGRLTDNLGNPKTVATNMVFKLYSVSTAGVALWTSGTCAITPDQDGIFSTLLGSSCGAEIAATVFSENASVWVGVTVAADAEATPRVQIATVAYALNSETLQGYPAGTGTSTIPYINSTGALVLANASPTIQSTSGTFAVEGVALTITTPNTSNGVITVNPDGVGTLDLTFEGAAAGLSANGFVNATNANITSGALYGGTVASAATGYNFVDFQSGVSPASKFSVSAVGNTYVAGTLGVGGTPAATALLDLTSTTKGFLAPRMDTTQRDAITTPATGLMIYNTSDNQYNVFNGTTWGAVGGGGGGAWSDITLPTDNLAFSMGGYTTAFTWTGGGKFAFDTNGNLGIGTNSATHAVATADVLISSDLEVDGVLYMDGGIIANSAGTTSIVLSATPTTVANTLSASNWLIENTANVGQAALIINQQKAGDLFTASASGTPKFTIANTSAITSAIGSWTSQVADSATAVGFTFNTSNTLSTQGSKLLSFQNLGTEKMYLDANGNLYVTGSITAGSGFTVASTNKSGGTIAVRSLVILDTANDSSFTTTTTPYNKGAFGVVMGVEVNGDTDSDGACDANEICRIAVGGEVEVLLTNASTAAKSDYIYTSATAGSGVASAKQFDGLIGVVSSTAGAGSGYVKMIFKVQPQVSGSPFYAKEDAALANGSYLELVHNQNTTDVVSNGWVYDGAKWIEIDDSTGSINISDPSLTAWWKAEEASGGLDNAEGTAANDLTASGAATYQQTGKINYAVSLDGTDDRFSTNGADNNNFDFDTGSFSLGGWFKHNTIATNPDYAIAKYSPTSTLDTGQGTDGAVTISADLSINTTNSISGRTCTDGGDAVNYSVTALTSTTATLENTVSTGCLVAGDEVLLINLRGTTTAFGNVGNYETLRVSSVSGADVNFTTPKTKYYGDGAADDTNIGVATTNQTVMLQRVPNYTNVTIQTGTTDFYPDAYVQPTGSVNNGGGEGGVMFFRANGTVSVASSTTINANARGWLGGDYTGDGHINDCYGGGEGGEAFCGPGGLGGSNPGAVAATAGAAGGGTAYGIYSTGAVGYCGGGGGGGGAGGAGGAGSATQGGAGGGGGGYCGAGSGGGYGTAGTYGSSCAGLARGATSGGTNSSGNGGTGDDNGTGGGGGGTFGDVSLTHIYFGAGGGAGGDANGCPSTGSDGGDGGGIVYIAAGTITVTGNIQSNGGTAGSAGSGGGGGGSGGSVKIEGTTVTLGTALVTATGGTGSTVVSSVGGTGGSGRIAVNYVTTITGTTSPTYTGAQVEAESGGYKLYMDSTGHYVFGIDDDFSSFPEDSATTETSYADNAWHHVVGVKTGTSNLKLYIDGQEVGSDYSISATGSLSNSYPFFLGADYDGTSNPWAGLFDEAFVYGRALSAGEVEEIYQSNSRYQIVQTDANTVRLYNYSGSTQNVKLNVIPAGGGGSPGNGAGVYTNNNASVANGSYIDVVHNQNTADLVTNGWVYNTTDAKWQQIENSSATGGTITTSGAYTIHTFTSDGTFTPVGAGDVEYLVVAGGGGGGHGSGSAWNGGGGGGAGGFRTDTGFVVTAQAYTVTVGGGGAGSTATGTNGNDSVFGSITATGGGGGGSARSEALKSGGSGGSGGGGSSFTTAGAGGSGTTGQGNNGGTGSAAASQYGGGGGGGASAVGGNGSSSAGGDGGDGSASSISGSSVTYAGGGGGGTAGSAAAAGAGGAGGGGAGNKSATGTAGTENTGGGGGGSGGNATSVGGDGGSGIVIVRYLTNSLSAFKITQQDANTVRLYNYSGATQNLRLDVITGGLGRNSGTVSLAPAAADVDSQASTNSIWINKTGSGGNLLKLQTSGTDVLSLTGAGLMTLTGNFVPGTDDTYDLGTNTARWKDIYLGPATAHIGTSTTDEGTISYDTSGNIFNFGTDSTTNADIAFFTDDLYLDKSTGNVGIGTTTPLLKLDIAGSERVTGAATSVLTGSIDATASTTVTGVGTLFTTELVVGDRITVTGVTKTVTAIASATSLTVDTAFTDLANDTSPDKLAAIWIARSSDSVPKMVINDLGNVGVGTTTPQAILHLQTTGTGNKNGLIIGRNTENVGDMESLLFSTADLGDMGAIDSIVRSANTADLAFRTNKSGTMTEAVRILANGNVGIGTTTPGALLDIYKSTDGAVAEFQRFTISGASNLTGGKISFVQAGGAEKGSLTSQYLSDGSGWNTILDGNTIKLRMNGSDALTVQRTSGNVGIGTTGPGYLLTVNSSTPGCNGCTAWTNYSDSRLKENIVNLSGDILDKIMQLNPVTFNYNDTYYSQTGYTRPDGTTPTFSGFIAQDLQQIFPEMVSTASSGYLDTNLSNLQIYLVKGIQQQQGEIASISGQLASLLQIDGSCVTGDTMLPIRRKKKRRNSDDEQDEYDEFLCRIDDILPGDEVLSLNEFTGGLDYAKINKLMDMGIQEVYELTTKSGRKIRTTANHPYLTLSEDSPIISKEKINV